MLQGTPQLRKHPVYKGNDLNCIKGSNSFSYDDNSTKECIRILMTLKAFVNLVENNKNFTADQKSVYQNSRKEEKITEIISFIIVFDQS
jgi:hypothetical protein